MTSGKLISVHKSLTELQSDLCIRLRDIQREMNAGNATCSWCGKRRSEHLSDKRCNVYATSQYFTNIRSTEHTKTEKALELLEGLMEP